MVQYQFSSPYNKAYAPAISDNGVFFFPPSESSSSSKFSKCEQYVTARTGSKNQAALENPCREGRSSHTRTRWFFLRPAASHLVRHARPLPSPTPAFAIFACRLAQRLADPNSSHPGDAIHPLLRVAIARCYLAVLICLAQHHVRYQVNSPAASLQPNWTFLGPFPSVGYSSARETVPRPESIISSVSGSLKWTPGYDVGMTARAAS